MYSRAEGSRVIKPGLLVVGIDVARRRHVATIRLPDGSTRKSFSFSNDRPGFNKLLARAESVRAGSGSRTILFAMESSGHYGHALKCFLTRGGHSVVGINPAHTKKAKEIEDNSPEKNDSKDSRIISDLESAISFLDGSQLDVLKQAEQYGSRFGKERLSSVLKAWRAIIE